MTVKERVEYITEQLDYSTNLPKFEDVYWLIKMLNGFIQWQEYAERVLASSAAEADNIAGKLLHLNKTLNEHLEELNK